METDLDVGPQPEGSAPNLPFLYFTVIALTSIADLFSERTRVLGLLDDDQQQLANALQRRWDLTQAYWARIAMFGRGRWPLEDIPGAPPTTPSRSTSRCWSPPWWWRT
ncbi:hypothetical protein [Thermocatellispora tengchongensis]|uniref:hypothetical protein n=1 Tax=Thermocatellispora tengchongensis TaxID=1073253 RepID=UPI00362D2931